jgi:hypothetical protein
LANPDRFVQVCNLRRHTESDTNTDSDAKWDAYSDSYADGNSGR